ncbi:hypothetical protein Ciccas_005896, partial [Cichlidogyrus casuarinus]
TSHYGVSAEPVPTDQQPIAPSINTHVGPTVTVPGVQLECRTRAGRIVRPPVRFRNT